MARKARRVSSGASGDAVEPAPFAVQEAETVDGLKGVAIAAVGEVVHDFLEALFAFIEEDRVDDVGMAEV